MKRYLFLLIGLMLISSACASENNNSGDDDVQAEEVDNGERDEFEYEFDDDSKLGFTIEEILETDTIKNDADSFRDIQTFDTDKGYSVKNINGASGNLQIFTFQTDGEDYPSAFIIRTNDADIVIDQAISIIDEVLNSLNNNALAYTEYLVGDEKEEYQVAGLIFNREYDINELPVYISDIATDDFFSDEDNINFYNEALNKAEYTELYDEINSYLEDEDVKDYDSAYTIIDILEPIQESMDKVEIEYDDFEDASSIYYQGLNDISSENYIVPFITSEDNTMNLLVGFEKEDWLFADNVIFNIDGERETFGTFNFDTDTLGGGLIREEDTKTNVDEELIVKIINADEVKMRFEGSKGELDYTLTTNDIDAIKAISSFDGIKNELSNLLYRFENN